MNNDSIRNQLSSSSMEPIAGTSFSTVSAVNSEDPTFYNDVGSKDEGPIPPLLDFYPAKDYSKQKHSYYTEFE